MKIKALAPWFGGKRGLARHIVAELGPHSSYFEPFCGSMAVLLNKPVSSHENVNDLHGDLINLALTIQHKTLGPLLYRQLRRVWVHESAYEIAREYLSLRGDPESLPDPERAYHYFIFSWLGRNGTAGTPNINCGFCRRWTPHGGHGGKRFASAVSSIPEWRKRMRNVTILGMDGFEFIKKIEDCVRTVLYVDPPYLQKGAQYLHDFEDSDHIRLAGELQRFERARVVVSHYDDPRLCELYPGWTKRTVYRNKNLHVANKRGATKGLAPEVLLINGPSFAADSGAALFPNPARPTG